MTNQNIEETYERRYRQFTENLRAARKEANKTQVEVAKYLNTTQAYVSKYESGDLRLDVIQLFALAKLYDKPIEDFFSGIE
ncbi:MAG: helix-turn-helix transcriptional regulator [Bacteroidota bacterium]